MFLVVENCNVLICLIIYYSLVAQIFRYYSTIIIILNENKCNYFFKHLYDRATNRVCQLTNEDNLRGNLSDIIISYNSLYMMSGRRPVEIFWCLKTSFCCVVIRPLIKIYKK